MSAMTAVQVGQPFVNHSADSKHLSRACHQEITPSNPTKKPIESPLTIDALIRRCSEDTPEDVLIAYPSTGIEYVNYTARQLDIFAFRAAQHYAQKIPQRTASSDPERVVALLGSSTFDYFITTLALSKLGHTVLFLSTRLSMAGYKSLLETTGASHLVIEDGFKDVARTLSENITGLQTHDIADKIMYSGDPLEQARIDTRLDRQMNPTEEVNKVAWIIHSSGLTGPPKPIYQTHGAAIGNYENNMNMRGLVTLPLYHAHGLSSVFRAITSRKQIYLYNASLPLTHDYLLQIMQRYNIEIFYGVPYALKILGESPEGIAALARLQVVMFGGSACPDSLGERLVNNGVNLISHYGT